MSKTKKKREKKRDQKNYERMLKSFKGILNSCTASPTLKTNVKHFISFLSEEVNVWQDGEIEAATINKLQHFPATEF